MRMHKVHTINNMHLPACAGNGIIDVLLFAGIKAANKGRLEA